MRANLGIFWQLLRIPQWSKNVVVFAALVFGDPQVAHPFARALAAFVVFCLVSSAGYIVNDCLDIERDRVHPIKRHRPIASGQIPGAGALVIAASWAALAFGLAAMVNAWLLLLGVVYLVLTTMYSAWLKHLVLVDAFAISLGFVLRAVAGAVAMEVPVSAWLLLCTMLLALLLAFGKRRAELVKLGEGAALHRETLSGYSVTLLDQLMIIVASVTIMAYSFYSFTAESVPENGAMLLTVPFVMFAVFRYLLLAISRGKGGSPEVLIWTDRPLLAAVVGWGIAVLAILLIS